MQQSWAGIEEEIHLPSRPAMLAAEWESKAPSVGPVAEACLAQRWLFIQIGSLFLGILVIKIIVYWYSFWGPAPICGNPEMICSTQLHTVVDAWLPFRLELPQGLL